MSSAGLSPVASGGSARLTLADLAMVSRELERRVSELRAYHQELFARSIEVPLRQQAHVTQLDELRAKVNRAMDAMGGSPWPDNVAIGPPGNVTAGE